MKVIFSLKQCVFLVVGAMLIFTVPTVAAAQIPVTFENYVEAQTSMQMNDYQKIAKGVNKWYSFRVPAPIDKQSTIRMNRDTLYSVAVVDVRKGAVVTLPKTGDRYISLAVGNKYGYTNMIEYGGGTYTLTAENVGSDYAFVLVRMLVDANSEKDIKAVDALQDKLMIRAKANKPYVMPNWDMKTYKMTYDALIGLFALMEDSDNMFGTKEDVDPILFIVGAAGGFGGLPTKNATYVNRTPALPATNYTVSVKDVPVDGFWSVTVYNKEGYLFESDYGLSNINSLTAIPNENDTYTLYFGNCEKNKENCLAIKDGWNLIIRLYQPRKEILSGEWTFPELEVVK